MRQLYKNWYVMLVLILTILVLTPLSSNATWLICHQPEFKGRIVDIENDQPIEGAVIVAYYQKNTFGGPGGKIGSTIHAKEALTDKNGNFRISSYTTLIQPFSWCDAVTFIVFKAGYLYFGENNLEDVFTGTLKEEVELFPVWNKNLKYKLVKPNIVKLPKVKSFEDRRKSYPGIGYPYLKYLESFKKLPNAMKIDQEERYYLNIDKRN